MNTNEFNEYRDAFILKRKWKIVGDHIWRGEECIADQFFKMDGRVVLCVSLKNGCCIVRGRNQISEIEAPTKFTGSSKPGKIQ